MNFYIKPTSDGIEILKEDITEYAEEFSEYELEFGDMDKTMIALGNLLESLGHDVYYESE